MWAQIRPLHGRRHRAHARRGHLLRHIGAGLLDRRECRGHGDRRRERRRARHGDDPAGYLADVSATFGAVEADGYAVSGVVAKSPCAASCARRSVTSEAMAAQATTAEIFGVPVVYALGGLWPAARWRRS